MVLLPGLLSCLCVIVVQNACGLCSAAVIQPVYMTAVRQDPFVLMAGLSLLIPVHNMLPPAGGRVD